MQYLVTNYYATGEGSTVCMLITKAYPKNNDGIDKTPEEIALNEFREKFGGYLALGVENMPKDKFIERYKNHLPEFVLRFIQEDGKAGNFNFSQRFHINFS